MQLACYTKDLCQGATSFEQLQPLKWAYINDG